MPAHRGAKPETDRTLQKTITMADAASITPSAEMLPVMSGTPMVAASTASGGIFAGMLAQRFQPSAEPSAKGAAADTAVRPTLPAGNLPSGQSSPQDGNTLPPNAPVSAVFDGGSEALSVMLDPLSDTRPAQAATRPDVPLQDLLTQVRDVPATSAAPPVGVIPPLLDVKPLPPFGDMPVPADERYSQPGRVASPAALPLAGLMGTQPEARLARPASLGLNARGETAEMLRSAIAPSSAEQAVRGGMAAQLTNQALAGDSLSRPFQQQIDHLLAMSRSPIVSAGSSVTLLALSDTTASIIPADLSPSAFLPGSGSDVRAGALTGPGSLPGLPVNTPMGQPGWSAELGQRMMWLANREIREAQIQLNPRHLGPIDVRIIYSDTQQLSVSFTAQNPAAREALDAALPRLREMFEQQGLNLADASVSQESFAGQQQAAKNENGLRHDAVADTHGVDSGDEEPQQPSSPVPIGLGLVDIFA
ncbi:MAG: flagellar hook-length control protein FliK [Gammaproteobacteria bacterium]|nr:flagellar hook-length control protein FliK [Gammaproteobacteria bacterium]